MSFVDISRRHPEEITTGFKNPTFVATLFEAYSVAVGTRGGNNPTLGLKDSSGVFPRFRLDRGQHCTGLD